ncbi:transmembrane emp24 domain-containing protein p24delta3-like [Curcuma longa]|uniref:transmembrane emp24 domain-containing protein p24delta3-like n=1 Tax=Curcuma longa TaxID=136217 RepID=UPI003D9F829D
MGNKNNNKAQYKGAITFTHSSIRFQVTSPTENTLHHQENITTGQFGFTASEQGTYKLCFTLDDTENTSVQAGVNIDWKIGFAARDWEAIAKKENIKGVELGLRKVVVYATLIHKRMLYLVGKGERMKNDSEKANYRVALFSLMSVAVCILSSALQLRHLKGYFHKKKLI